MLRREGVDGVFFRGWRVPFPGRKEETNGAGLVFTWRLAGLRRDRSLGVTGRRGTAVGAGDAEGNSESLTDEVRRGRWLEVGVGGTAGVLLKPVAGEPLVESALLGLWFSIGNSLLVDPDTFTGTFTFSGRVKGLASGCLD